MQGTGNYDTLRFILHTINAVEARLLGFIINRKQIVIAVVDHQSEWIDDVAALYFVFDVVDAVLKVFELDFSGVYS